MGFRRRVRKTVGDIRHRFTDRSDYIPMTERTDYIIGRGPDDEMSRDAPPLPGGLTGEAARELRRSRQRMERPRVESRRQQMRRRRAQYDRRGGD